MSEFPLAFPRYGEVAAREEEMLQYPKEWQALEVEFDIESPIQPNLCKLITQGILPKRLPYNPKWIDMPRELVTQHLNYSDLPVKYNEILNVAKARVK